MDDLDVQALREFRPFLAVPRFGLPHARVLGDVEQSLFGEMRNQPGVGSVHQHAGRALGKLAAHLQRGFAIGVIGAPCGRNIRVVVAAGPWLDAGIDVKDVALLAILDGVQAVDVIGCVDQEIAFAKVFVVLRDIGVALDRLDDELDAQRSRNFAAERIRRDDGDLLGLDVDMPQDERQRTLAHRPETDDEHPPLERRIFLVAWHYSVAPGQIAKPLQREGHVIDEVGGKLKPTTTLHLTPALSPSLREAEREREKRDRDRESERERFPYPEIIESPLQRIEHRPDN